MHEQLHNTIQKSGMVAHAYNSSTQEAETGGLPQVQGKTGLHCETFLQKQQQKSRGIRSRKIC